MYQLMIKAATASATTGASQRNRRLDAGVAAVATAAPEAPDVKVSSAKLRSLADWNRCSGFFSRHRRTILPSTEGILGFVSLRSGGSTVRIAFMSSTAESPENGRAPQSIS